MIPARQMDSMLKGKFWRRWRQNLFGWQILEHRTCMPLQDATDSGVNLRELLSAGDLQLLLQMLKLVSWCAWPQELRRAGHA